MAGHSIVFHFPKGISLRLKKTFTSYKAAGKWLWDTDIGDINFETVEIVSCESLEVVKPERPPGPITLSIWPCNNGSPSGWCEYNSEEDPVHDQCVYCGQPEERK